MRTFSIVPILIAIFTVIGASSGEERVLDWSESTDRDGLRYGSNSEEPFTGKLIQYWPNGQKLIEYGYCDGIQHGKQMMWYEDGQKWLEGDCKYGKLDGIMTAWYEDGQKGIEGDYRDGRLYKRTHWLPNGKKESDQDYPNGKTGKDIVTPTAIAKEMRLMLIVTKAVATAVEPPKCLQYLDSPDGKHKYALFHDIAGVEDHEWFVIKLEAQENPDTLIIPKNFKNCNTSEEKALMANTFLFNWSEGGDHRANPHIKLMGDRYLVFERGGFYHGLYDIVDGKTLITDKSPWHSLIYSDEYKSIKPPPNREQRKRLMDDWVRKTLHDPISKIIDNPQSAIFD